MSSWLIVSLFTPVVLVLAYLIRVNYLLNGVPNDVKKLASPAWTKKDLERTYNDLKSHPIDYTSQIPPKLDRRYIVTGGNGLVGGYIVLQLLARGTSPLNIRIVDIRKTERNDLGSGSAAEVEYVPADIRSMSSVTAAFHKPWDPSISHLPLTVFHTAAVILASDRSPHMYGFPESVNVKGTQNVITAAKAAGADILISTSSSSVSVRPINPWVSIWAKEPKNFFQALDEQDYYQPLRAHEEFFGNYPASKAIAERMVCAENSDRFRTGCIRPANGVYGNPTDNVVGGALSKPVWPTWIPHIVHNFVHGANVAIAHLHHEAALLSKPRVEDIPQAGRPFVVTDPNPPIAFNDLYRAISTLSVHPFRPICFPPALILVCSYVVEWYNLLPYRVPLLGKVLPEIKGDARYLQPGLFTICTHLIASDAAARLPVPQGGLGYEGVMTTMQGMVLEILEWNRENGEERSSLSAEMKSKKKKLYTTSVMVAEQMRRAMNI